MADFFGGSNNSKQYEMMMAGTEPIDRPISLVGHSFTGFNNEQIDRVTTVTVRKVNGQIQERQEVLRAAVRTGVTFTVQFGSRGEFHTPLLARVRRGNCRETLYIKRLCPDKPEYEHFYTLPDVTFDAPTMPNDMITIDDTTNIVAWQAEAQSPDMILSMAVVPIRVADITEPLHAIAVRQEECAECEEGRYLSFVIGGGAAGEEDDAYLATTDDRFSNVTVLTHGVADGNTFVGIYTLGNVILACFVDDFAPATALTGGTVISVDEDATFTIDSNITAPVWDVDEFLGEYIACGGIGAGQALFWTSSNGVAWTSLTDTDLPATETLLAIAVDNDMEVFYAVGTGGLCLKGTKSGSQIFLTPLAPTGVTTTTLLSVAVLGPDHVAIGGESNYYAESFDGGSTWENPSVPGTASIYGIAGVSYIRAALVTGTVITERTIMTNNEYETKTLQNGVTITGDYHAIASLPGEHEYFFAVTDDGEIVALKPIPEN